MKKFIIIICEITLSLLFGIVLGNLILPIEIPEKTDALKELNPIDLTLNENYLSDFNFEEELALETLSPYTGNILNDSTLKQIPFMCIIENSKEARPQSGLSEADIIYETLAEAGIPRFLALFFEKSPDKIGPIRSVRPYFLELAREYNLPFAHCGGSFEALDKISKDSTLKSINEIKNGVAFWRDTERKAPHNLYTSSYNIRKFILDKKITYSKENLLNFKDNALLTTSNYIKEANLKLSDYYETSYKYVDGFYEKYMDNELAIDKNTNMPLKFKNVVIQLTSMNLQNDNLHLNIDLIGKGHGYLLSNGRIEKITWEKNNPKEKTILKDQKGDLIYLSRGNTIWNIVHKDSKIFFK